MKRSIFSLLIILLFLSVDAQTNLSALMAVPSQAEIDAVKAEWATRDHTAVNWTVLHTGTINGFAVDVVSHEVNGELHYGAVRYPENYVTTGSYPVLVVNHGAANGTSVGSINAYQATCYRSFFIVIPSFRSEELRTMPLAFGNYLSEGTQSEMDGDTDDALGLLSGVLEIPGADAARVGAFGGSRGGGVSHLMAAKSNLVKRVCAFYGATDHMTLPGLQAKMENYVDFGGGLTPPENATYTYGVAPYLNETLTLEEARLELLRRSVVYFVDELPLPYQVHHGGDDPVVTVNHSQNLAAEFLAQSIISPDFDYYEYPGELHSLPVSTGAPALKETFLCELNSIVLDIELTDFQGTCKDKLQQISIEWTALIGQSASSFDLEWSADTHDWKTITTLSISQSPNQLANYIYNDSGFQNGQNHYRLKETDNSGNIEYHRTIEVTCGSSVISISPNPSSGIFTIQLDKNVTIHYPEKVLVFDVNGRNVFEKNLSGLEYDTLDLSGLAKGTYSCHFLIRGQWVVERVVLI